jgi:hypothetical protein
VKVSKSLASLATTLDAEKQARHKSTARQSGALSVSDLKNLLRGGGQGAASAAAQARHPRRRRAFSEVPHASRTILSHEPLYPSNQAQSPDRPLRLSTTGRVLASPLAGLGGAGRISKSEDATRSGIPEGAMGLELEPPLPEHSTMLYPSELTPLGLGGAVGAETVEGQPHGSLGEPEGSLNQEGAPDGFLPCLSAGGIEETRAQDEDPEPRLQTGVTLPVAPIVASH